MCQVPGDLCATLEGRQAGRKGCLRVTEAEFPTTLSGWGGAH